MPGWPHRKQNFLSRLREQFENVRFGWLQFQHKRVFEVDGEDEVSDCARNRGFLATCAGVRALFAIRELRLERAGGADRSLSTYISSDSTTLGVLGSPV